ncbi:MAG: queuosine salvage family protein [Phycisphaerae bacterium]
MLVLDSTRPVVEHAAHVRIDDGAIERWACAVTPRDLRPAHHDLPAHLPGDRDQLANLVLLIDALNFCFWSPKPIETVWQGRTYHRFEAMFVSLLRAARREPRWCDPEYWVEVSSGAIREALYERGVLLLLDERERILREVGRTLIERFDGRFIHAVESADWKAWPLAELLMNVFDSFRDVSMYRGRPVYFLKRAQIAALDLSVALEARGHSPLAGLEVLTAFADYRVPQALRHLEILKLSPAFAGAVERGDEIERDSDREIELRAATLHAVERMRTAAAAAGKAVPAWQIDWNLWGLARRADIAANHHRTRTVNY